MRGVIRRDQNRLLIGQQLPDRFRPLHFDLQEPFVTLLFAERVRREQLTMVALSCGDHQPVADCMR